MRSVQRYIFFFLHTALLSASQKIGRFQKEFACAGYNVSHYQYRFIKMTGNIRTGSQHTRHHGHLDVQSTHVIVDGLLSLAAGMAANKNNQ